MNAAVSIRGLRKSYVSGWPARRKEVLKGLDLTIPSGGFWGLLGPNGAGKTTLLSIISNLLTPDEGEVRVLGMDIRRDGRQIYSRVNLSSGHANFLWSMTVKENLQYYAMLYGLPGKTRRLRVDYLMDLFDLRPFARERFDELSTGTKQKLSLAKSMLNEPQLLLLDEPTVGLDPDVSRRIRESIREIHQEKSMTILMTTHNMPEVEILCEQVAFLREGVIKAVGKPRELKRGLQLGDVIVITAAGPVPTVDLEKMEGVYSVHPCQSSWSITVDDHRFRVPEIIAMLLSRGVTVKELRVRESNLEDVFIAFAR